MSWVTFSSTVRIVLLALVSALIVSAQPAEADSITLFSGPNGTGEGQVIPVGSYFVNIKLILGEGKNSGNTTLSVRVPKGMKASFCDAPAAGTQPKCEFFADGTHNLSSVNFSQINVAKDAVAAGISNPPLVVFEAANWMGRSQRYGPGMYRADRNEFGKINNDMVMSVIVAKGFLARFCQSEGKWGRGADGCEEHEEGRHNIRLADSISFIEVLDLSDTGPQADKMPVILYEDSGQGGKMQGFDVGTFLAGKGMFGKVLNDTASSIKIKDGYRVTVCSDETPSERCEELGPGKHDLKLKDSASYIKVWKVE